MREWWEHWYNRYAVVALTTAVAIAGYEGIHWACLSASDWGTWVGAIGTVGTLIGTIWLATSEQRRQNAAAELHAKIVIVGLVNELNGIGIHMGACIGMIDEWSTTFNQDPKHWGALMKEVENALALAAPPSEERLLAIAPLVPGVAAELMYVQSRVKALLTITQTSDRISSEYQKKTASLLRAYLRDAKGFVDRGLAEIVEQVPPNTRAAINESMGKHLPGDEL